MYRIGNKNIQFLLYVCALLLAAILHVGFSVCVPPKRSMKILMVVSTFPKIHDICILNQITGLIDRGHDVRIFAYSRGDTVNVQQDVISYNLMNRTTFERFPHGLMIMILLCSNWVIEFLM